jgi:hypothetical protein
MRYTDTGYRTPTSSYRTKCIAILLLISQVFLASCAVNNFFTKIPRAHWVLEAKGPAIDYFVPRGDKPAEPPQVSLARLESILNEIGSDWYLPDHLSYYCMPNRKSVARYFSESLTGYLVVDPNHPLQRSLVTIHSVDIHELIHAITVPHTQPVRLAKFWMEGIAMYYSWPEFYRFPNDGTRPPLPRIGWWKRQSVHGVSQSHLKNSKLPSIKDMISNNSLFDSTAWDITYPVAGSFVSFLLGPFHQNSKSISQMKAFFADANVAATDQDVRLAFQRHFGRTIEEAETAWLKFLETWQEDSLKTESNNGTRLSWRQCCFHPLRGLIAGVSTAASTQSHALPPFQTSAFISLLYMMRLEPGKRLII